MKATMAKTAIIFAVLLIILGLVFYVGALAGVISQGHASPTALIPTGFGVILLICGLVAMNPANRKHAMHAAAMFALLGLIGAVMRPITAIFKGTLSASAALYSQVLMAILCAVFLALCIRSFINARRGTP